MGVWTHFWIENFFIILTSILPCHPIWTIDVHDLWLTWSQPLNLIPSTITPLFTNYYNWLHSITLYYTFWGLPRIQWEEARILRQRQNNFFTRLFQFAPMLTLFIHTLMDLAWKVIYSIWYRVIFFLQKNFQKIDVTLAWTLPTRYKLQLHGFCPQITL